MKEKTLSRADGHSMSKLMSIFFFFCLFAHAEVVKHERIQQKKNNSRNVEKREKTQSNETWRVYIVIQFAVHSIHQNVK